MRLIVFGFALLFCAHSSAQPLSTAFSYQGELVQGGMPAVGDYDFQFVLFDSDDFVSGIALTGPATIENHPVLNGRFTVEIDFGSDIFGLQDVWLEVRVREGASAGAFTTLEPRQKVTPVPLALHASEVVPGAIGSEQIEPGAVGSDEIADSSVSAVDVNVGEIQLRVFGDCAQGSAIRTIHSDGNVICEDDDDSDTTYSAGSGLELTGTVFSVDPSAVQTSVTGMCSPGWFVVGINPDGSVVCRGQSIPLVRTLEQGGAGQYSSIAVRANGSPLVSHAGNTRLGLYVCENTSCATGTARALETGSDYRYTSIALRQDGTPIISYEDADVGDLKVYRCDDVECTSGSPTTLDSEDDVGRYTSIAIRDNGLPIISYRNETDSDLYVFVCDDTDCSSGTAQLLDSGGFTGEFTSIAIRHNGLPIISYYDASTNSVNVYDCTATDCSTGSNDIVADAGTTAGPTSIAIRQNGLPVISYRHSDDSDLMLADCLVENCFSSTNRKLDQVGPGTSSSIAVRLNGNPIISYNSSASFSHLRVYDCINEECSQGSSHLVVNDELQHYGSDIAIRPDGMPFITWHDDPTGALRSYSCGGESCE